MVDWGEGGLTGQKSYLVTPSFIWEKKTKFEQLCFDNIFQKSLPLSF